MKDVLTAEICSYEALLCADRGEQYLDICFVLYDLEQVMDHVPAEPSAPLTVQQNLGNITA